MDKSGMKKMSATEVKNRLGAVLREVTRTEEPILIERDGRPVAVIVSIHTYEESCRPSRPPSERGERARAAFGMWSDRPDIDEEWLASGRRRWESEWTDA